MKKSIRESTKNLHLFHDGNKMCLPLFQFKVEYSIKYSFREFANERILINH